jgi:hypothetical protein
MEGIGSPSADQDEKASGPKRQLHISFNLQATILGNSAGSKAVRGSPLFWTGPLL